MADDLAQLISYTDQAVELASDYLRNVGATDFAGATEEQRNLAKDLEERLKVARKQIAAASKAIKALSDKPNGAEQAEDEEEPPEFGHDEFIHTLANLVNDEYLLEDEFWILLFTKQSSHSAALTVALQVAARGLHGYTMEKLAEVLAYIDPANLREACASMDWGDISENDNHDMVDTFKMLQNATSPLEVINSVQLAQHMTLTLRVLRWALQWRTLDESPHPTLAKQAKEVEMWRIEKEDNRTTETIRKDRDFKHFHSEVADYRRGANRVLHAYETLGSIVIICPHFRWMAQKDSRLGNTFSELMHRLDTILEGAQHRVAAETVFHDLAHDMVAALDPTAKSLVPGLAQVEAAARRDWMPPPPNN